MVDRASDTSGFELPRWRERLRTAPSFPGGGEAWIELLPQLLTALAEAGSASGSVVVAGFDTPLETSDVVKKLGPAFVYRRDRRIVLNDNIIAWLSNPDPGELIVHLHQRIQLIGELLTLLCDGPLSHERLRDLANTRYGMSWTALDQVRRRTTWLRAAGLVELYDGTVNLTAAGQELLATITVGEPEPIDLTTAASVAAPLPEIVELLGPLRNDDHEHRSQARSMFIPSPAESSQVDVIRRVVGLAVPEADEESMDEVLREYGLAAASARQARASLKTLGLIRRARLGRWAATSAAVAWLDSGDDIQLARIVHAHVWFLGEILHELRGGPATAANLAACSARYGRAMVPVAGMRTRCGLLRECGLIDKFDHNHHQLTPSGRALLVELPVAQAVHPEQEEDDAADHSESSGLQPDAALVIAEELLEAMRDSAHPTRFELAVCSALKFLGFAVEHLSGPARTDVAAQLSVPQAPVQLAVEAKTAGAGPVSERDVGFQALREHREKIEATTTVLIGPEFHRRVHAEAASDQHVAILEVQALAEVVTSHSRVPFSPRELRILADPALTASQRGLAMRNCHQMKVDLVSVLDAVVTQLDLEVHDDTPMYEGGWLGPNELRRDLRKLGAGHDTIVQALQLLASPFVGVAEERKGRYRLIGSRGLVTERLRTLANLLG